MLFFFSLVQFDSGREYKTIHIFLTNLIKAFVGYVEAKTIE